MSLITVACACLNQTPLAWRQNLDNILSAITTAKVQGASILCLPELAITGYGCEDAFFSPDLQRRGLSILEKIIPQTKDILVAVGLPLYVRGELWDAVAVISNAKLMGFVCKQYLAREGVHYEPRWFRAWVPGRVEEVQIFGSTVPCGDLYFSISGLHTDPLTLGFEICEDAWSPKRPGVALSRVGVDIILNPSASHFSFGKFEVRKRFVLEGSRSFGCSYLYANLLGNEAGRLIYDGGALIASAGTLLSAGRRLSFEEVQSSSATIDIDALRVARQRSADAGIDDGTRAQSVSFTGPKKIDVLLSAPTKKQLQATSPVVLQGDSKEQEFSAAISLGLFDYLRKSRSNGFVVSMSGGADSASIACAVKLMVQLAYDEIGPEKFKQKLSYISKIQAAKNTSQALHALLTCVYQASQFSSNTTRNAAETVSKEIGAEFYSFDIEPSIQKYIELVQAATGTTLSWSAHDIALQNIQARTRGPGVWLLTNVKGALLLATSNRSEAAVGYTTMDGDTCGGLSPIAGVSKSFIRSWLVWHEQLAPHGCTPVKSLALVNAQAPTAELRSASSQQTDEKDLMPYVVLDRIEQLAIKEWKEPAQVYAALALDFPQHSKGELKTWIKRFFTLWRRNQWKRERYAPSFHLDDHSLDSRGWCRFPILTGDVEEECKDIPE